MTKKRRKTTTLPSQDALRDIFNALEVNIPYINKYGLQLLVHVEEENRAHSCNPMIFG